MSKGFTKQYILDRITARKRSLESKAIQASEQQDAEHEAVRARQAEYLEDKIVTARKELKKLTSVRLGDDLTKNYEKIRALGQYWSIPAANAGLGQAIKDVNREYDLLEHAEAYLAESPVDEYSTTALKQLGLLEAVKFNLADAQAAKS